MKRRRARLAALLVSERNKNLRGPPMSTVHDRRKALRGTKRTCQACEARFYDLGRDPIICPVCGADYAPSTEPAVATARAAPFSNKTGWRRQPVKRLAPALPAPEAMPSDRFATAAADEEVEEAATVVATDDNSGVPEEQDETDVADLVEHTHSEEGEPC
jgi:uncharacterized protein (TIGR02300 family)